MSDINLLVKVEIVGPWWWSNGHRPHLHSDNPSSNPVEEYSFYSVKLFGKNETNEIEARMTHLNKDEITSIGQHRHYKAPQCR